VSRIKRPLPSWYSDLEGVPPPQRLLAHGENIPLMSFVNFVALDKSVARKPTALQGFDR
jgi:hypothetical protein